MSSGHTLAGRGEPVVLIHGSMNSKSQWLKLAEELKVAYTVIAIDLTGYGETPFPEDSETHSLQSEVAHIRRTLYTRLGGRVPVHIVAHAYGGAVALCLACDFPEDVRSLNLFEPMANHLLLEFKCARIFSEGRRLIDSICDDVARDKAMAGAETFIDYFSGRGIFSLLPEKAQNTLATYIHKMLVDYRTTIETDLRMADYRRIACPFCLVTGSASSDVSLSISHILNNQMDGIDHVEIEGNHMAPIASPQNYHPVVTRWLDRVAGPLSDPSNCEFFG